MAYSEAQTHHRRMSQNGSDDGTGPLHSEIECTRRAMDQTLHELARRLTPGHFLDQMLGMLRGSATGRSAAAQGLRWAGRSMYRQAREHPVPASLIAGAMAWWIFEGRGPAAPAGAVGISYGQQPGSEGVGENLAQGARHAAQRVQAGASAASHRARELGHEAAETARIVTHQAAKRVGQLGRQAADAAAAAGQQVQRGARQASQQVARAVDDYPLSLCLATLAVGAAVGAILPHTPWEDRLLGKPAEQLRQRVSQAGRQAMDRGGQVGKAAAEAAMHEVHRQADQSAA